MLKYACYLFPIGISEEYSFLMGRPGLFSIYFRLFKQTLQFLQQYIVKNVHPVYGAGIQTPQPLEHESPPITTRLGLVNSF